MFVNSFNHFRAIAITFIVAGHCLFVAGIPDGEPNTFIEAIFINIIAGGTSLFVFISGFLFHLVFYKKYTFSKFLTGKLKNILIPYLLLGILPVLFFVVKVDGHYFGYFLPQGAGWFEQYGVPAFKYYATGRFLLAYWYIPFIIVTFSMSPLHVLFIQKNRRIQLALILVLSVVSIFIHRPLQNMSVFQSVIYFTPVYLLGISCSMNKEQIYSRLKNKEFFLLILVLALAFLQALLGEFGSYHKSPFLFTNIDLMFIQKNIMCLFFMVWLHRFEHINNRVLHTVAATSFTVFFIHPFIIWVILKLSKTVSISAYYSWTTFPVLIVSIMLICISIALTVRRFAPKISRYIIGY